MNRFISLFFILIYVTVNAQSYKDSRQKADSILELAAKDAEQLEDTKALIELVRAYNVLQNDSVLYYSDLLFNNAQEKDYNVKARANFELHRYYRERSFLNKADSFNREAFRMAKMAKDSAFMFSCAFAQIAVFFRENQMDSTLMAIKKAQALIHMAETELQKAHFYQLKGLYFNRAGNSAESLEQHMRALKIYRNENAFRFIPNTYDNIGVNYASRGEFKKALENFEKGLALNKKYNYPRKVLGSSMNVALAYVDMANENKGIQLLKECIPLARELKDDSRLATIYNNIGYAYGKIRREEEALDYYFKSLKMEESMGDDEGYVYSALNIAESFMDQGAYESAGIFLEKALETAKKIKITEKLVEIFTLKSQIDSAQGNFKNAFSHFKEANRLQDSLKNISDTEKLQELRTKYETLEKENEIEKLTANNKSTELELTKQRYQKYGLLSALLFAFVIAFGIYNRYKTKGRLNQELIQKNEEIQIKNKALISKSTALQSALDEREVLIKEIQHRVKNNLQLIASMLNLQGGDSQNKEIRNFLERSRTRISAMALVHQTLYDNDTSGNIDFKVYLEKLIHAIHRSFYSDGQQITYTLEGPSVYLDINTSITVGIIVNELVHNAFKHAFANKTSGHLKVNVNKEESKLLLEISDNGGGMKGVSNNSSFGLKLVAILTEQLEGKIKTRSNSKGTKTNIVIDAEILKK